MAISKRVKGVEVTVCVDGKPLEEFDAENDKIKRTDPAVAKHLKDRTVTKYIQSQSDKEFIVEASFAASSRFGCRSCVVAVLVDGQRINSQVSNLKGSIIVNGFTAGSGAKRTLRLMKFGKIDQTSDEASKPSIERDMKIMQRVGQIEVLFHRISQSRKLKSKHAGKKDSSYQCPATAHEQAMKGDPKSHGLKLGPAVRQRSRSIGVHYIDGEDYPIARFVFKYRSLETLKALHVVHQTPSPEPELQRHGPGDPSLIKSDDALIVAKSESATTNHLTEHEKVQVQELLRNLRSENAPKTPDCSVKRERDGADNSGSRKKARMYKEKVTIDLTEDIEQVTIDE